MKKNPNPKAVAFLQNVWVKRPDEVRAMLARQDEEFRVGLIRRLLFYRCKTGRNLTKAFGELLESIVFEETTREIAGDAKTIFPPDIQHIREVIWKYKPEVVITFGQIAKAAVCPIWNGKHIHAHHPASRHKDSWQTLVAAAAELREWRRRRDWRRSSTALPGGAP
jgi:hypothetical protein